MKLEISDDKKIEILEDIEDSWTEDVNEEYKARYEAEKKEMEASIASLKLKQQTLKLSIRKDFSIVILMIIKKILQKILKIKKLLM